MLLRSLVRALNDGMSIEQSGGRLSARGRRLSRLLGVGVVAALSGSATAGAQSEQDAPSPAGPFARGQVDATLRLGTASSSARDYLIVGGALGWYVLDGLRLGVGGSLWLFGDPLVATLTPEAKFVFYFVPVVQPYLGTFVRRYASGGGVPDHSSAGLRGGLHLKTRGGYYGIGAVYEHALGCSSDLRDCDDWYPEVLVSLSF